VQYALAKYGLFLFLFKVVELCTKDQLLLREQFWHVFTKLSHYCKRLPYFSTRVLKGKSYYVLGLATRSLPYFTELIDFLPSDFLPRNLFYLNGVKVIPSQIFDLLTPVALAHWICGDGTFSHGGLLLCTDSFTIPECPRLINVLMVKYSLNVTLQMIGKYSRIYIKAESMPLLRSIVLEHMDSKMLYKLWL
jgi:hypothetical protein